MDMYEDKEFIEEFGAKAQLRSKVGTLAKSDRHNVEEM